MSYSPTFGPCAPNPVCGPSPAPRLPAKTMWQQVACFFDQHLAQPVRDRVARDRLLAEMNRMDHRELQDLGMVEDDVPYFVAQWKPKH